MKELEALEVLKANAILFDDGTDFGASMIQAILDIEQALTPPTQREVIEAIQNDIQATCYYDGKRFNVVELFENGEVERGMSINEIQIEAFSPLTLILIGRFYESNEEVYVEEVGE